MIEEENIIKICEYIFVKIKGFINDFANESVKVAVLKLNYTNLIVLK